MIRMGTVVNRLNELYEQKLNHKVTFKDTIKAYMDLKTYEEIIET